jgi:hypothetical protein
MPLGGSNHYEVDEENPRPVGACDCCKFTYNLDQLRPQTEWRGVALMPTGFLHCPRCLDVPNATLRTIILKPDPEPVTNPRPGDGQPIPIP